MAQVNFKTGFTDGKGNHIEIGDIVRNIKTNPSDYHQDRMIQYSNQYHEYILQGTMPYSNNRVQCTIDTLNAITAGEIEVVGRWLVLENECSKYTKLGEYDDKP